MRTRPWLVIGAVGALAWLVLAGCAGGPPEGTLPTFEVTDGPVVTPEAADALAEALGIPSDNLVDDDGAIRYLDADAFVALPMNEVPPASLQAIATSDVDEQTGPVMAFDFAAIGLLPAVSEARALTLAADALAAANLTPGGLGIGSLAATPEVNFAQFEAFDVQGVKVAEARLDGQVAYDLKLGTRRLMGPGAVVQLSFDGAEKPTQVAFALRGLQQSDPIQIVSSARAEDHATALYLAAHPDLRPLDVEYQCEDLVYYAPPLGLATVEEIFPHYDCSGTATTGEVGTTQTQQFELLRNLVPAVDDVPVATLTASIVSGKQDTLQYTVAVSGGTAPYTVVVSSGTTAYVAEATVSATTTGSYPVYPFSFKTEEPLASERVLVSVSDANGLVGVPVSQDVPFPSDALFAQAPQELVAPAVSGVVDFGTTRGVCDLGAGMQSGFRERMVDAGASNRFNWSCMSSWERDFRETGTGLDPSYVDNVDMTFYIGHGWPGGFTFDNATKDKGALFHNDPARTVRWGNQDLEWLALVSCSVLRQDAPGSGGAWYQRWGQEFDGLHLLLGFHTSAYDWSGFGRRFADWMLGRELGFLTLPPVTIVGAWLQASKEQQPDGVVPAVMGVYGTGGISNYGDYFHGKGPVGPDLRGADIAGWWYLRGP